MPSIGACLFIGYGYLTVCTVHGTGFICAHVQFTVSYLKAVSVPIIVQVYRTRCCTGPVAVHVPLVYMSRLPYGSQKLTLIGGSLCAVSLKFWAPNGGSVIRQQDTQWPGLPPGTIEYSSICPPRSPPVTAPQHHY